MKRTLLLAMDFPPRFGGVANYWANLCGCLPADDLVVLAPECDNSLDFDSDQKYLIFRKVLTSSKKWLWPKWLPFLFFAFNVFKKEKIQKMIVAQVLPGGTIAYILKKHYNVPYIVSCHGLDVALAQKTKWKAWLFRHIMKNAQTIIANSNFTKRQILDLGVSGEEKVKVVYPCPCIKQMLAPEEYEKIKARTIENNNFQNKKIILTVARLVERKGQDKVIEAMSEVVKIYPNAIYLMVGKGPYEEKLRKLIHEKRLEKNVYIFNDVMNYELPIYYDLCDLFVMPSRQLQNGDVEGFGIVYLEANLFAKPVIAGRSGGVIEAVENNFSGLLVDPLSVNEIKEKIISLFENPDKARQLGINGRQRAIRNFNWQTQAEKLEKILSE